MRHVEQAEMNPHCCAGYPQLGRKPQGGLIDSGCENAGPGVFNNRVYISIAFMRDAAAKFPEVGLTATSEYELVCDEKRAIQKELEDVQAELAECNRELDAISTLRARGYQPEKRRGRPPVQKAA